MRSRHGVLRTEQPAKARERPAAARRPVIAVEEPRGDAFPPEEDDAFQWFVNLFVAEYAAEAANRLDRLA